MTFYFTYIENSPNCRLITYTYEICNRQFIPLTELKGKFLEVVYTTINNLNFIDISLFTKLTEHRETLWSTHYSNITVSSPLELLTDYILRDTCPLQIQDYTLVCLSVSFDKS
jgi:hypothetical protein